MWVSESAPTFKFVEITVTVKIGNSYILYMKKGGVKWLSIDLSCEEFLNPSQV